MTYIKFENQTYAEKAASVLRRYGYSSRVRRNPNPNHSEGCNFALFSTDIRKAYEIITNNRIPNLGIEEFGDKK